MIEETYITVFVSVISAVLTLLGYKVIKNNRDGEYVRRAKFIRDIGDIQYRLESLESLAAKMNAKYSMRNARVDNLDEIKAQLPDLIKSLPLAPEEKEKLTQIIEVIPESVLKSFLK